MSTDLEGLAACLVAAHCIVDMSTILLHHAPAEPDAGPG
jgi:hypothetical protein